MIQEVTQTYVENKEAGVHVFKRASLFQKFIFCDVRGLFELHAVYLKSSVNGIKKNETKD